MIYIIDEKSKRQISYGWNIQRFEKYKNIITPIYDYSCFESEMVVNNILSEGNVILFHESFFNGIEANKRDFASKFIHKLDAFGNNGIVVYYSGSKSSRKINGNVAFLPVSVLYQHLEIYLNKINDGNDDISYLIWGVRPLMEKSILDEIVNANEKMLDAENDFSSVNYNILAITSSDKNKLYIPDINPNITIKELFHDTKNDEHISDKLLHDYVISWLQEKEYDSIILPMCFGPILSDFNGLRLAMHIRCTATPNQKKPIYIYSVANMSDLIHNEYFDVLRTNGIQIINYDYESILSSMVKKSMSIEDNVLKNDMRKIKLNLPQNYIDSHSIANEWAIYRWAKTIGADDEDIENVISTVETNLYFKYLNTIYPVLPQGQLKEKDLTISLDSLNNNKPKVLLVDDEAQRGWYEIFCIIFNDINHFYFRHLDEEFNEKTSDEIIKIVHEKIEKEDIDVVVLDYRLHKSDFFAERIEDITGFKVLKDIKNNINRGIQVIILSATNKIWNLEALQNAEADGFIMKDNPEGFYSELSTKENIHRFKCTFENCCDKLFLKQFYKDYKKLETDFKQRAYRKIPDLSKDFVKETMKWFKLSCDILKLGITEETKASSFLFLFSVVENIANYIVDTDNPEERIDNDNCLYLYKFRKNYNYLMSFNKDMIKTETPLTIKKGQNIPWNQKILNALDFISVSGINVTIKELITKRNNFIHANATTGEKIDITKDDVISLHNIVFNGLIKI